MGVQVGEKEGVMSKEWLAQAQKIDRYVYGVWCMLILIR